MASKCGSNALRCAPRAWHAPCSQRLSARCPMMAGRQRETDDMLLRANLLGNYFMAAAACAGAVAWYLAEALGFMRGAIGLALLVGGLVAAVLDASVRGRSKDDP